MQSAGYRRTVRFTGSAAGPAPLTWAQETTWADISQFLPDVHDWFFMRGCAPVPAGLSLDTVLDRLGVLIGRHESVRSLLTFGDRVTQTAVAEGGVDVTVLPVAGATVADTVDEQIIGLSHSYFDHTREFPLRVIVVLADDIPAAVVFGIAHVFSDMRGAEVFGEQLGELLDAAADGLTEPPLPPCRQPIAEAVLERGPIGRRINAAAMSYLRKELESMQPSMFGPARPHDRPRFRTGLLSSRAAAVATPLVAQRLRTSTSAVLLAATAAILRCATGVSTCHLGMICGNRFDPALRRTVGTLTETGLVSIATDVATFDQLVPIAVEGSMRALRHGRFDTLAQQALLAEIQQDRGVPLDLRTRFNDMWSVAGESRPTAGLRQPASTFEWVAETDNDTISFFLDIFGDPDEMRVRLLVDTYRIPDDAVPDLLTGFERLLIALVEHDVALADLPAVTGLRVSLAGQGIRG